MDPSELTDQLNRPLRDLRISVTDRCNFRCKYCMPADVFGRDYHFLRRDQILTFEEIVRVTRIFLRTGSLKLRLTGGEPLLRQNVDDLVRELSVLDGVRDLAMTTNGVRLPQFAQKLKEAGLRRVTISLDSLDNDVFRRMNGDKADVADVQSGIAAAEAAGFAPIKINAVVQRGVNDHTLLDLARYAKDHGYTMRFIEYMDAGTRNGWRMEQVVPAREIVERIDAVLPLEPLPRSHSSETALRYRYRDGGGEIGVIASVTIPFCGACSRIRLSPDGTLYTCLFADRGTDLKAPLRAGASDDDLEAIIRGVWSARTDRYSLLRSQNGESGHKIEMHYIGG